LESTVLEGYGYFNMNSGYIASAIVTLLGTAFAYFIVKLWKARAIFVKLKKQGLVSGCPRPRHVPFKKSDPL
jgi:hypothetical protein